MNDPTEQNDRKGEEMPVFKEVGSVRKDDAKRSLRSVKGIVMERK